MQITNPHLLIIVFIIPITEVTLKLSNFCLHFLFLFHHGPNRIALVQATP